MLIPRGGTVLCWAIDSWQFSVCSCIPLLPLRSVITEICSRASVVARLRLQNGLNGQKKWGRGGFCYAKKAMPGISLVVQWLRIHLPMQEVRVRSLVRKVPWKRKWQPTLVFLPEKSYGQRILAGYSLWGHKASATTEHEHTCMLDRRISVLGNQYPHVLPIAAKRFRIWRKNVRGNIASLFKNKCIYRKSYMHTSKYSNFTFSSQ